MIVYYMYYKWWDFNKILILNLNLVDKTLFVIFLLVIVLSVSISGFWLALWYFWTPLVFCVVFNNTFLDPFRLAIALFVLLGFTVFDCPFGIFKFRSLYYVSFDLRLLMDDPLVFSNFFF
jgi:hypothetical protein